MKAFWCGVGALVCVTVVTVCACACACTVHTNTLHHECRMLQLRRTRNIKPITRQVSALVTNGTARKCDLCVSGRCAISMF